mgnify:FL=1
MTISGLCLKMKREMIKVMVENTTTIGEVLAAGRGTARIFMEFGMHCLSCPHSQAETIEEACAVHGANADELVHQLNEWFADNE